jgi:hypothetical protein
MPGKIRKWFCPISRSHFDLYFTGEGEDDDDLDEEEAE